MFNVHTDINVLVVPVKVHQIDDKFMFELLQNSNLRHQVVSTCSRELILVNNLRVDCEYSSYLVAKGHYNLNGDSSFRGRFSVGFVD